MKLQIGSFFFFFLIGEVRKNFKVMLQKENKKQNGNREKPVDILLKISYNWKVLQNLQTPIFSLFIRQSRVQSSNLVPWTFISLASGHLTPFLSFPSWGLCRGNNRVLHARRCLEIIVRNMGFPKPVPQPFTLLLFRAKFNLTFLT